MTDDLAKGLADTLMRAAEDQVAKAQTMLDQTKALVEIMNNQVAAQLKLNEDMNARFRQVGERMLDVHRILNGERGLGEQGTAARKPTPLPNPAGLLALDALKRSRINPAGIGTVPRELTIDPKRANDPDYRAPDPAGQRQLPRAVAGSSEFDSRNRYGENYNDPGTATKQPDRD